MTSPMIAFTFPGQGSQKPQMGEPWAEHPSWELTEEASEASGRDVAHLLLKADVAELTETRNSQLATYVLSMVALDAVQRIGIDAAFFAGHSLGEYSALTAAGSISFSAGVKLVTERGNAMQAAADAQPGTMAAIIGVDDDVVETCCAKAASDVWVANYNTPGQVVIAGSTGGVDAASELAKEAGAKRVIPIAVGGAFHTMLMAPARDRLKKALADTEFRSPSGPVVANVDAQPHDSDNEWEQLLAAQLTSPVRWSQTLRNLSTAGANVFIELGAGNVLSGMLKRTVTEVTGASVSKPADLDRLLEKLATEAQPTQTVTDTTGEQLHAVERLVISPCSGVFTPNIDLTDRPQVKRGQLIGTVGDSEVLSPFSGSLQGMLALAGERVNPSQPLAWLRTQDPSTT